METIWIISQRLASSNSTYYASLKVTECVGKLFIMRNSWKLKLLVFGAKNAKNWIITSIIIPQRKCPRIIKCVRWESFFFELNDDVVLQQCVSHSELIQSFRVFFSVFWAELRGHWLQILCVQGFSFEEVFCHIFYMLVVGFARKKYTQRSERQNMAKETFNNIYTI